MRLAHETANAVAQTVGWDDKTDRTTGVLNTEGLDVAVRLAKENIAVDTLTKQRRGYLAVKFPDWTTHEFQSELEKSDSQLLIDGLGIEITAIDDDRFRGKLLTALLARLTDKPFDSAALATVVREVLASDSSTGKTFGAEIVSGALGASAYRKSRLLHIADDDGDCGLGDVHLFRNGTPHGSQKMRIPTHSIMPKTLDLRLAAFSRWLMHQPSVPDNTQIDLDIFSAYRNTRSER